MKYVLIMKEGRRSDATCGPDSWLTRPSGRRMVRSRITAAGLELLSALDDVVIDEHKRRFEHLSQEQLRTLVDLLTAIRQKP